jgi:ATP-dependent Clp protease adapter protein ClpS
MCFPKECLQPPSVDVLELIENSSDTFNGNTVVLYNDESHTFDEVTLQIMKAINCSEKEAFQITYMIDRSGSANVYIGEIGECIRVSSILQDIGLKTQIEA